MAILVDMNGGVHDIFAPDFDLQKLCDDGSMPQDYELCGTCLFDHQYDMPQAFHEIKKAHEKDS
jgi:hypothetical protein